MTMREVSMHLSVAQKNSEEYLTLLSEKLFKSETEIKPRIINRNFGKHFDHYDNNNFFGFHPKQAFLPPTHYKFG